MVQIVEFSDGREQRCRPTKKLHVRPLPALIACQFNICHGKLEVTYKILLIFNALPGAKKNLLKVEKPTPSNPNPNPFFHRASTKPSKPSKTARQQDSIRPGCLVPLGPVGPFVLDEGPSSLFFLSLRRLAAFLATALRSVKSILPSAAPWAELPRCSFPIRRSPSQRVSIFVVPHVRLFAFRRSVVAVG